MERLLILSSDTGEGHNSAAGALRAAAVASGWDVSVRKPLEESESGFRFLGSLYNLLLTHRPAWVGLFARSVEWIRANEAEVIYKQLSTYIQRFVESEAPDAILSVHPMLNHMIQRWVTEKGLPVRCFTFVTDPFPPFWRGWSSTYASRHFVLTDEAGIALTANGVAPDRIERVSMPLRPGFRPREPEEIAELRARLNLKGETILVNGGARGGGPLRGLVHTVLESAPHANVLVVCGHNVRLRQNLEQLRERRLRTFGFVEQIHTLVGAADLVITKPGALSTYEALASKVPAVLTALGGLMPQESGMFRAATDYGFGFAVRTADELRSVLAQGVTEWKVKRDAIVRFYNPATAPQLIERIQPSHG